MACAIHLLNQNLVSQPGIITIKAGFTHNLVCTYDCRMIATDTHLDAPPSASPPHVTYQSRDSQIATIRRRGAVHLTGAGEPPPLRGVARVLRRGPHPRPGRRTVRLHPSTRLEATDLPALGSSS